MRALLLAASLDEATSAEEYWRLFESVELSLDELRVHDPFMGGGSTLIEASRLGATVSGTDIDPTSRLIVAHGLEPAEGRAVHEVGEELLKHLRANFETLYPSADGNEALHMFWIPIVTCPACAHEGPLFRSTVLGRDCGKRGAVVRNEPLTIFEPETLTVRHLNRPNQMTYKTLSGRRARVDERTFDRLKYACPECKARSSHRALQTGAAPVHLVAVEHTKKLGRRTIAQPSALDREAVKQSAAMLADPPIGVRIPTGEFDSNRSDDRPRSYGINRYRDLFSDRQLLVLGAAHRWIDEQSLSPQVDRAIRLALSNALSTNNRLCSYAADYGRLSPLFSIRGYSMPALMVELNPLNSLGGRGTLLQCINRVARSAAPHVNRSTWDLSKGTTKSVRNNPPRGGNPQLTSTSAASATIEGAVDLLVFDPPYYDYIVYDELAELFRAWNPDLKLGGQTLQSRSIGDGSEFGVALADCLRPALRARSEGLPIAFTYHSSKEEAWDAIGVMLDELKLVVTAAWPVRSDGHMGHHSHAGNCEWDIVVVCRPLSESRSNNAGAPSVADWVEELGSLGISEIDQKCFELALVSLGHRWGQPKP